MPYFVNNGAFSDFMQDRPFREKLFEKLLLKVNDFVLNTGLYPDFIVAPDRVNDPIATEALWQTWSHKIKTINSRFKLAYVVQPTRENSFPGTPPEADVIFIGGLKPWKFQAVLAYRDTNKPIHVGGISASKLYWCHLQGGASGDSSGFFRGDMSQLQKLYNYLADSSGQIEPIKAPKFLRREHGTCNQLTLFF